MDLRLSSIALAAAVAVSAVTPLAGCDTMPGAAPASTPASAETNVSGHGVVRSVEAVQAEPSSNALGTVAGALLGGVLGNQIGGGKGNTVATVAGAAGGAYAGHEYQKSRNSGQAQPSYRITVQMDDGSTQTLTQATAPTVKAGDRVRVAHGAILGHD